MRTRSLVLLAGLLAAVAPLLAEDKPEGKPKDRPMPVSEEAIVREMEEIIDRAGPVNVKDRARAREIVDKGTKAHDRKEYEKAVELYREALDMDPLNDVAYYELAFSYAEMGEQTKALDCIVRALAINP